MDAREKLRENSFEKLPQLPSKIPIFPQKNANRLQAEDNISVHKGTVQRTLKRSGITNTSRKNRLLITEEHQKKRINFVKDWKDYTFEDVWITDECVFQLQRKKCQVWSSKK